MRVYLHTPPLQKKYTNVDMSKQQKHAHTHSCMYADKIYTDESLQARNN